MKGETRGPWLRAEIDKLTFNGLGPRRRQEGRPRQGRRAQAARRRDPDEPHQIYPVQAEAPAVSEGEMRDEYVMMK